MTLENKANEKEVTYNIRLDADLKEAFVKTAKSIDRTGSQLIREFMRDFVRRYGQADLFRK